MISLMTEPAAAIQAPTTLPTTTQRIVLTGFMGAGKSTVGRLLATKLGWQFLDIDHEIEAKAGMTIAEIFETEGEFRFRHRESSAIARALGRTCTVIALGGGAPEILANRLLLEQTRDTAVIFLDAPFEVLFDRCVLQEGAAIRPVLMDPEGAAERFRKRAPHYRRCAQHHILTANQHPEQTATAVLNLLQAVSSTI
jgi:shikimate kinase